MGGALSKRMAEGEVAELPVKGCFLSAHWIMGLLFLETFNSKSSGVRFQGGS